MQKARAQTIASANSKSARSNSRRRVTFHAKNTARLTSVCPGTRYQLGVPCAHGRGRGQVTLVLDESAQVYKCDLSTRTCAQGQGCA